MAYCRHICRTKQVVQMLEWSSLAKERRDVACSNNGYRIQMKNRWPLMRGRYMTYMATAQQQRIMLEPGTVYDRHKLAPCDRQAATGRGEEAGWLPPIGVGVACR